MSDRRLTSDGAQQSPMSQCAIHDLGGFEQGHIDRLAQLVEGEILPRLMLVHGRPALPEETSRRRAPSQDEVEAFCRRLLDPLASDLTDYVLSLLRAGSSLESLLAHLLVPSARQLGLLWEQDECDFVDVTIAIGRLQAVTRELCAHYERWQPPVGRRSILLLACPGETHTYALSVVASFFRESGWSVVQAGGEAGSDAVELARDEWFDLIGVSLACDTLLPVLTDAVQKLRRASCNRNVKVLVGGPFFCRQPDLVGVVGADATAKDGRSAPQIAESLLEMPARAC